MKRITYLLHILLLFLWSCGSREFTKNPVDQLILEMDKEKNFTIILYDMDIEGTVFEEFKHRYKIITNDTSGMPKERITDWILVDEEFFDIHSNDLGMEIASKKDGVVEKNVAPPGYSNYVGNEHYGSWRTNPDGTSFWEFYGQYAFMSNMIGLMAGPVYRTHYYDYQNNYRNAGVPYYGTTANGTPMYGTSSDVATKQNPNSKLASNNSFKSKIQNRVARSSGSSSISGERSSSSSKTKRSTSRKGFSRSRSSSRGGK
ncbi:MAG: hypothetical protein OHK0038_04440 [Flammeovirgaceae bacterium]